MKSPAGGVLVRKSGTTVCQDELFGEYGHGWTAFIMGDGEEELHFVVFSFNLAVKIVKQFYLGRVSRRRTIHTQTNHPSKVIPTTS